MNEGLVLLGVASDSSVEQWGGLQTPRGFLLRWFHRQELGFPDHVYRATIPDFRPLPWHEAAAAMDGQTHYEHAINGVREVTLSCEQGFQFASPSV